LQEGCRTGLAHFGEGGNNGFHDGSVRFIRYVEIGEYAAQWSLDHPGFGPYTNYQTGGGINYWLWARAEFGM